MTTCLFSTFFLGKSTAPTVAAADQVEQCPSAVPESVYQTDLKTMQLHIEEAAVTSARGKGKMSGKRMIQKSHAGLLYKYNMQVYNRALPFYFSQLYEIKC